MSKRTKFLLGIGVIAALVIGWQVVAFAVHDEGAFQLDGDATTNTVPPAPFPGDDWDRVCHQVTITDDTTNSIPDRCTNATDTNGATAVAWNEETNRSASIFTGGGSKDPNDLDQWEWKNGGGLPDKDNLLNAFAARYTATIGGVNQQLLYFGSDRYDNSGDAVQGFWFFQNDVTTVDPDPPANGTFSGLHKDGDLLILSDFSNGGGVSTIAVYEWDAPGGDIPGGCTAADNNNPQPNQCGAENLRLLASSTDANCASSTINNPPTNDRFCGIVNPSSGPLVGPGGITTSPWPFTDKSGNSGFLNGEFFEGGVNLSAINLGDRCFASFASETRASTSPTATLKDFIVGGFGECTTQVTTNQSVAGEEGQDPPETSIGTGSITVHDSAEVNVTGTANWEGAVQFSLKGPIGSPLETTKNIGNPVAVSDEDFTVDSINATVTAVGDYCWSAHFESGTTGVPNADDNGENECFKVNPVTPALPTTASPDVVLGNPVTDTADLSGTATQPGDPAIDPTTAGAKAGGTITFTLLKDDCSTLATGTGQNPQTVPVDGNGTYGPVSFTPDAIGTYHWKAQYTPAAGDPNNLASTHNGDCSDSDETVVVGDSSVTTQSDPTGSVSIGTGSVSTSDSATVNVDGISNWEGTVQFSLKGPIGSPLETTKNIGNPVAVSDEDFTVDSINATVTAVGDYCWSASFTSETQGVPDGVDNGENECFTVTPVTPQLATTAGQDVLLGNPVTDTADLSGTATQPGDPAIDPTTAGAKAGGTITFTLLKDDCSTLATGTGQNPQTVPVDGNGTYGPVSFTPDAIGTYHWKAQYTPAAGDPNNLASTHNDTCNDTDEDVDVNQVTPTIETNQRWLPNDSATISADGGGNLNGTVRFRLYDNPDCTGTPLYDSNDADGNPTITVSGSSPQTVSSANTTELTDSAEVSWLVEYTSNNQAQTDVTSACNTEHSSLTIDNDTTSP